MSKRGVGVLIGVLVGAIIGGVVGHAHGGGQVVLETAILGVCGAVLGGVIVYGAVNLQWRHWTWPDGDDLLGALGECCLNFAVLVVAGVVTIAGFLLWHSLALAALAGVGVMTVLLVVLSAWARSYKDASAVQ